uniref:Uncharacterized protein n=1 Tax=Leersia perrieri TaxID=77586 RepID=A0A0D9XPE0_9ORYZ
MEMSKAAATAVAFSSLLLPWRNLRGGVAGMISKSSTAARASRQAYSLCMQNRQQDHVAVPECVTLVGGGGVFIPGTFHVASDRMLIFL